MESNNATPHSEEIKDVGKTIFKRADEIAKWDREYGERQKTNAGGLVPHSKNDRLDVKKMMEFAQVNIVMQNIPKVLENTSKKIDRAHKILHEQNPDGTDTEIGGADMEMVKLSDKAEERLLQSIGVIPSKSVSVMIGKMVQQNVTILPPEALDVLRQLSNTSDVIDLKQLGMEGEFESDAEGA